MNDRSLALFDFDGTIISKDSFIQFIIFTNGKVKSYLGFIILTPVFLLMYFKVISNKKTKEIFLFYFFRNKKINELIYKGNLFKTELDKWCKPKAIQKINWHKTRNDMIVIVSASSDIWIGAWCDSHNIEMITTKLETVNDKLTGKIIGENCNGFEKVRRINEKFDLKNYKEIYAYGDSPGDLLMLNMANFSYYQKFK